MNVKAGGQSLWEKRSTWLTWEHIPMEPVREFRYTM